MDEKDLAKLDAAGYSVLEAITHDGEPKTNSAYKPQCFVCIDGRKYWVKHSAQQGLVAELVSGRLAARTSAGPDAKIIRVPQEAIQGTQVPADFVGIHVGTLDMPDTINAKDFSALGVKDLPEGAISTDDRARVVVFQTWLGAGDAQVLVDLLRNRLYSIDHGEVFGDTSSTAEPTPVITDIPGVKRDHGCDHACVRGAVGRIESISDVELLECVARMPTGPTWRSDPGRRLAIAQWLSHRRAALRGAIAQWR
jgi:hypothetical protein